MNKWLGLGRLTRDPEIRKYNNKDGEEGTIASFTVAVDRMGKDAGADFVGCKAFGKTAEFIEKYFTKGSKIAVEGRITTGSYDNKDGNKVYTTEVTVEKVEFAESKSASQGNTVTGKTADEFTNIPEGIDEELPFA